MNHWHFILGAYGVGVVVLIAEILAVRARRRAALGAARATAADPSARAAVRAGAD